MNKLSSRNSIFRNNCIGAVVFLIAHGLISATLVVANYYELENSTNSIVGEIELVAADASMTLLDIAREYGFGYYDIKLLNPDIDTWMPDNGEIIQLPSKFILPNAAREGIVINIPEMRLYYFPETEEGQSAQVITYPIGIAKQGWVTPYKKTQVIGKKKNPDWRPPESIKHEYEEAGIILPDVVEAGPDNPLGDYALQLGLPAYLIHGTNKPSGVGMRVSHGCIRLYPEDIEELFERVELGTVVNIINQPYKIGESDNVLYLEVHPPLSDIEDEYQDNPDIEITTNYFDQVVEIILDSANKSNGEYVIDWDMVGIVSTQAKGIPVAIGMHLIGKNEP